MSWSVLRGVPYPSQQYLDRALAEVGPGDPRHVTLPQILYHCLNKHTDDVLMINGTTGVKVSNGEMLKQAVLLARALRAQCASGTVVMLCMKNHEHALAVFYASLFAGVLPFMMDPYATVFEFTHFLKLVEPRLVFCDGKLLGDVNTAITDLNKTDSIGVVAADDQGELDKFTKGQEDNVDDFDIPCVDPYTPAVLIPTSGSTGLPKAAIMTQRGLVIHLPIPWAHYPHIPHPTECAMLLTTLQWMTFTMHVTSCPVYRVPLLLSPEDKTVEHVKHLIVKYRPSWTFFNPAFAKSLLTSVTAEDLSSLKTLMLLGSASTTELWTQLKATLSPTSFLVDAYGTTETQGYIAYTDPGAPLKSCGPVINILEYKLLDEDGREVGLEAAGELYVRGDCLFKVFLTKISRGFKGQPSESFKFIGSTGINSLEKLNGERIFQIGQGYYKNPDAYSEAIVDGWYRTGDKFYIDSNERLRFVERIKFSFKFRGCQVSPEEVEGVILSVSGVADCCVCGTERGPAAAIIMTPNANVTREQIHTQVNNVLSDHKRLHGGIAFVGSLPHTHSGKLQRLLARELILRLQKTGECY